MKKFYFIWLLPFISLIAIPLSQFQIPYFKYNERESFQLFKQGVSSFNSQFYHTSRNFFLKALNIMPKFYYAKRYLAESYYLSGNLENALEEYEILRNQYRYDEFIQYKIDILEKMISYQNYHSQDQPFYEFSLIREMVGSDLKIKDKFIPIEVSEFNGFIYLLTYEPPGLWIFDRELNLKKKYTGSFFVDLKRPKYLYIHNKFVLISDYLSNRIIIFDTENQKVKLIKNINTPQDLFVFKNQIYIWSGREKIFYKYDFNGDFLGEFVLKSLESEILDFSKDYSFTTDGSTNIYLGLSNRIYIIDEAGYYNIYHITPLSSIKKIKYHSLGLLLVDENKYLWFCKRETHECMQWNKFYFSGQSKSFEYISSAFFNGISLHVTDVSGRYYYFSSLSEKRKNLILDILRVESSQFPNVAVQLRLKDFSKSNFLMNLNQNNFQIFENDKRIYLFNIKNMERYKNKMHLLIIKDNNLDLQNFSYEKQFKKKFFEFLDQLRISDNLYVASTDENLKMLYQGNLKIEIYDILKRKIPAINSSSIFKSIEQGIYFLLPIKGKKFILYLTDGTLEKSKATDILQRIEFLSKIHSVPIFVISLEKRNEVLEDLAVQTEGIFFYFYQDDNFSKIYSEMLRKELNEFLITYESPLERKNHLSGKYIDITIKLNFLQYGGMAQGGYIVP